MFGGPGYGGAAYGGAGHPFHLGGGGGGGGGLGGGHFMWGGGRYLGLLAEFDRRGARRVDGRRSRARMKELADAYESSRKDEEASQAMQRESSSESASDANTADPMAQRMATLLDPTSGLDCLYDVTLLLGPSREAVRAHRVVLAARSPVFAAMLFSHFAERELGSVEIPDIDPGVFRMLLHAMYTGELQYTREQFWDVLLAASKYDVESVLEMMRNHLANRLTMADALAVYENAPAVLDRERRICVDYLAIHAKATLLDEHFLQNASEQMMIEFCRCPFFSMDEAALFVAVQKWAANQDDEHAFQRVLQHIRLPTMSIVEFMLCVESSGLLSTSQVVALLSHFGMRIAAEEAVSLKYRPRRIDCFDARQRSDIECCGEWMWDRRLDDSLNSKLVRFSCSKEGHIAPFDTVSFIDDAHPLMQNPDFSELVVARQPTLRVASVTCATRGNVVIRVGIDWSRARQGTSPQTGISFYFGKSRVTTEQAASSGVSQDAILKVQLHSGKTMTAGDNLVKLGGPIHALEFRACLEREHHTDPLAMQVTANGTEHDVSDRPRLPGHLGELYVIADLRVGSPHIFFINDDAEWTAWNKKHGL